MKEKFSPYFQISIKKIKRILNQISLRVRREDPWS